MSKEQCFVIAIAGGSGSGKTALVSKLIEKLQYSEKLLYDDYKPNYDDFIRDLKLLRNGQHIEYPKGDEIVNPSKFLIIEDPVGITDFDSNELVDFVVYIDTPLEISLTRLLLRAIYNSSDESIEKFYTTIGPQHTFDYKDEPTKLMHILVWLLENYISTNRQQYIDDREKQIGKATLVVDGLKDTETLTNEVLGEIKNFNFR